MKQKKRIVIDTSFSPQVYVYLEEMLEMGIYGTSISEVVERIVCRHIQDQVKFIRNAVSTN